MRINTIFLCLCAAFFAALCFYSWQIEPGLLKTKTIEIVNPSIQKNCTIAFMADLHFPILKRLEEKIQNALLKIKPDIILVGGDFSDYKTEALDAVEKLRMLSRFGKVVMVLGNTDVCGSRQCVYCFMKYPVDRLAQLPAILLRNENFISSSFGIRVIGLDDPVSNKDDTCAMRSVDGHYYNILLVHNNSKLTDDQKQRFNLICSGHTHGAQLFFLRPFLHAFDPTIDERYISGIYKARNTDMLVTSGIGESVLPVRLGVPPEIMVIRLRK